jgi:hypothetical protein
VAGINEAFFPGLSSSITKEDATFVKMYGQGFHLHEGHAVGVIKDEDGRPMRVHNNKVLRQIMA